MTENTKNNFERQEENENKPKKSNGGRARKYETYGEYIEANREKAKARGRVKAEFIKQLKKERKWAQLELTKKLKQNLCDQKYIDWLYKEMDKHEEVNSRVRDKGGSAE